jgi:argininosuccinate lyase
MEALTMEEFRSFRPEFEEDIYGCLTVESAVNVRNITGGTSLQAVRKRIKGLSKRGQGKLNASSS